MEGEATGEINRSPFVKGLVCHSRGREGGVGLASALGVNIPQTHQTFHLGACLERKSHTSKLPGSSL